MPKDTTGQDLTTQGIDPKKLKPLDLLRKSALPIPIWESFQGTSAQGKGFVQSYQAELNGGVIVLFLLETGFRTDVWEIKLKLAARGVKLKKETKGLAEAQLVAARLGREYCVRAAHCADYLAVHALPF